MLVVSFVLLVSSTGFPKTEFFCAANFSESAARERISNKALKGLFIKGFYTITTIPVAGPELFTVNMLVNGGNTSTVMFTLARYLPPVVSSNHT